RLAAAGLIESTRGTGGGIRLARDADAISLADIVEAVEGPIAMTACVDAGDHDCGIAGNCRVKPHWNAVNRAVRDALAGVTLATLAAGAEIVEIDIAPLLEAAQLLYGGPWVAERTAAIGDLLTRAPDAIDPTVRAVVAPGADIDAVTLWRGMYRLAELKRHADMLFQDIDLLAFPTT
ncbi:hypothetical protein LTR94_032176, partial [Friedmanniomyces endolithicus]